MLRAAWFTCWCTLTAWFWYCINECTFWTGLYASSICIYISVSAFFALTWSSCTWFARFITSNTDTPKTIETLCTILDTFSAQWKIIISACKTCWIWVACTTFWTTLLTLLIVYFIISSWALCNAFVICHYTRTIIPTSAIV